MTAVRRKKDIVANIASHLEGRLASHLEGQVFFHPVRIT